MYRFPRRAASTGKSTTRPFAQALVSTTTLTALAFLTACGGGEANDRCADSTNLFLSFSWTVNGVSNQSTVQGRVGQPLVADPVINGLPASCTGKVTYRIVPDLLPPGLALDTKSGRISGTATQAKHAQSLSGFTIQPEGYFESDFPFRVEIAP
jgi:hypothetical protein